MENPDAVTQKYYHLNVQSSHEITPRNSRQGHILKTEIE